ncbi:MAG: HAMP domain-containing histidine kinase [Anaerolineae bacterium]|nr:HAMP domain-containing histidine kinase [Anaerolineae bacterium]MDW8171750.1 HAMP domain-containing sensor histidine kinase [Anaerolineae bacterium]
MEWLLIGIGMFILGIGCGLLWARHARSQPSIASDQATPSNQTTQTLAALRQITSFQEVSALLNSSLDLTSVNDTVLDAMMSFSQADAGFLAVTQGESIIVRATRGRYAPDNIGRVINFAKGITGRAAINQRHEWLPDVSQDEEYFPDLPETVSLMAFALVSHEHLVGVVCLESQRRGVFNQQTFDVMSLLADRAAAAIDNAQLYDILNKKLSELQKLYEQTDQLERFKSQMIELAAHQMKNAVMQLSGPLDLLDQDKETLGYPYDELIGIMGRAALRIRQIATDIMSLEKIERRYQGDYVRTYNLTDQLNTLYEAHQQAAERKGLHFIFERFPLFPVRVRADDVQLYEAIANLLSNAIKYTPDGGEIELALEVKDRQAVVIVRDTGPGIAQEHHDKLFRMFSRIRTADVDVEGTGLGLFLFKSIVERFGGQVFFESAVGQGSTFGFRLPITDESTLRRPTGLLSG